MLGTAPAGRTETTAPAAADEREPFLAASNSRRRAAVHFGGEILTGETCVAWNDEDRGGRDDSARRYSFCRARASVSNSRPEVKRWGMLGSDM